MTDPPPASGLRSPVRNRYFYGKLLDAAHLQLEQDYLNGKRWLLNRLVTGSGVVAGLEVVPAADGRITISPGVALDLAGREIIVAVPADPVDPRQPTDDSGRPAGTRLDGAATVTVSLVYVERATEPAPVYAGTDDGELASAPSLLAEGFAVVVTTDGSVGVPLARLQLPDAGGVVTADRVERSVAVERMSVSHRIGYRGGDAQSQAAGTVLPDLLSVAVSDVAGAAVDGAGVTFAVRGGGGALSVDGVTFADSVEVRTGADGTAAAHWRLGDRPGIGSVSAGIPSVAPVTFVALGQQP